MDAGRWHRVPDSALSTATRNAQSPHQPGGWPWVSLAHCFPTLGARSQTSCHECNRSGFRRRVLRLRSRASAGRVPLPPPPPGPDAQGPPSQGRCVEVPVGVSAIPPVSALPGRELSNCIRDRDSSRHARFWTGILFQNLPSRSWFCDYGPLRDFSSKSRH